LLKCQSYNCDKDRVSTYDPIGKTVWFQGHLDQETNIMINALTFEVNKATGKPSYTVWSPLPDVWFGYTNFQYYNYPSASIKK